MGILAVTVAYRRRREDEMMRRGLAAALDVDLGGGSERIDAAFPPWRHSLALSCRSLRPRIPIPSPQTHHNRPPAHSTDSPPPETSLPVSVTLETHALVLYLPRPPMLIPWPGPQLTLCMLMSLQPVWMETQSSPALHKVYSISVGAVLRGRDG